MGPSLVLWGIALTVVVHLLEISLQMFVPTNADSVSVPFPDGALPVWLHWLLTRTALAMIAIGALLAARAGLRFEEVIEDSVAKAIEAADQAEESGSRLRSLCETTSDSVYCYSFDPPMRITLRADAQVRRSRDAVLVECNGVFARELKKNQPSEVIGTTMADLDSTKDEEAHARFIEAFIDSGYRLSNYEMVYRTLDGETSALSVNLTGIVEDGLLHRFWGVENNILDVRRTRVALYRRRMFQELLATISSKLVMTSFVHGDEAVRSSLEEVCGFIGGTRMSIAWVDWDNNAAELKYWWVGGENKVPPGDVSLAKFPFLGKCLINAETVVYSDLADWPENAATDVNSLHELGVISFLFLPVVIDGEVVAAVSLADDEETRHWTEQDVADLRVIAELFANYELRRLQREALDNALSGLKHATERLEAENVYLRNEIKLTNDFAEIVGESDALKRSLKMVEQVADTMTPVLILGETGTGKELIARALHEHSDRRDRPLVKVNCAALPANLIESELFGYEKGAFTSAESSKRGRFDLADGSTLFLDEIGEIPIELQAKLLRVLQEGEFERLGGHETTKVDVRIVAATNRDLSEAVAAGEFRSDLFYRINTFPIELPPLRERGSDIQLLAEHFAGQHAQRLGREVTAISANMMRELQAYSWPGNVRELDGVIQRALISSSGPVLELGQALSGADGLGIGAGRTVPPDLKSVEREHIVSVLNDCNWKISGTRGAASKLEVPPSTLRSKMKRLGIERPA